MFNYYVCRIQDGIEKKSTLRFEKVFNRLDEDGDGKISIKEFRAGLGILNVKDAKKWTVALVKKLFAEFDVNKDGLLSVEEFAAAVKGGAGAKQQQSLSQSSSLQKDFKFEDEDGDDEIFRRHKVINDSELFRKVTDVLSDVVPEGNHGEDHLDLICAAVRRFFQRADPDSRGVVSEERFRAFCRYMRVSDSDE